MRTVSWSARYLPFEEVDGLLESSCAMIFLIQEIRISSDALAGIHISPKGHKVVSGFSDKPIRCAILVHRDLSSFVYRTAIGVFPQASFRFTTGKFTVVSFFFFTIPRDVVYPSSAV